MLSRLLADVGASKVSRTDQHVLMCFRVAPYSAQGKEKTLSHPQPALCHTAPPPLRAVPPGLW